MHLKGKSVLYSKYDGVGSYYMSIMCIMMEKIRIRT